ncbi:MAG: DUF4342 domain-containing protein [Dethiobacteria bacterium]|nr:DUF4342 domain-containing protein [Bacillota bacterium]
MSISLEAIDEIRQRTNCSYLKAREVLERSKGDVVEALVLLEKEEENLADRCVTQGRLLWEELRNAAGFLHKTRFKVKVKESTLLELPVTVGALGAALFPKFAALGLAGLLLCRGEVEIAKPPEGEARPGAGAD